MVQIDSQHLINSFISCGILYTVRPDYSKTNPQLSIKIQAEFDFRIGKYIKLEDNVVMEMTIDLVEEGVSNIQYDSISDSLSIFNNGHILTVAIKRKKFIK